MYAAGECTNETKPDFKSVLQEVVLSLRSCHRPLVFAISSEPSVDFLTP